MKTNENDNKAFLAGGCVSGINSENAIVDGIGENIIVTKTHLLILQKSDHKCPL